MSEKKKANWMKTLALGCAALLGASGMSSCVVTEYQDSFGRASRTTQYGITPEQATNMVAVGGSLLLGNKAISSWEKVATAPYRQRHTSRCRVPARRCSVPARRCSVPVSHCGRKTVIRQNTYVTPNGQRYSGARIIGVNGRPVRCH